MRVVIFGASGMVGKGVLLECLDDARVASVLAVGRSSCGVRHDKLTELLHDDFEHWDAVRDLFAGCDACFYCLGVTSAGTAEADYRRITRDYTVAAANAVLAAAPQAVFCFVSGAGADSTERSRVMWARVKGEAENAVLGMPFRAAYVFRPSLIQPVRGVRSRTGWYTAFYTVAAPFLPLMLRIAPGHVTTSARVGRAMLDVAIRGHPERVLHSRDINRLTA
jgi:uncharacterized protein YbjT (DUF2867 family)